MFQESMERFLRVTGCKNQLALATFLEVHPSAIAAGKKRGKLPSSWLITALRKKGVNPDWVESGLGPQFLVPAPAESSEAAWHYSLQVVLTNTPKLLRHIHMRELLAEAYRRSIVPAGTETHPPVVQSTA